MATTFVEETTPARVRTKLKEASKETLTAKEIENILALVYLANVGKLHFKLSNSEVMTFSWEKNGTSTIVHFS